MDAVLKQCPSCQQLTQATDRYCRHCGRNIELPAPDPHAKRGMDSGRMLLMTGLAIFVAIFALLGGTIAYNNWTRPAPPTPVPTLRPGVAPVIRYTTLVGFDEAGKHITEIWLRENPADSYGVNHAVYTAREGDRVAVIEQRANGTVKVRTVGGIEGWTQVDSLKDPR